MMLQGVVVSGKGVAAAAQESGGELGGVGSISGGFSEEERGKFEEGERNSGGNRWPRQEALALLKIRSDMDVAFRDSSLKGPLWDEVSRKLAELGYHRSAKKCKEKFENVYKYHKRTKDGRTSKTDGKTYRFFDQLEALETTTTHPPPQPLSQPAPPPSAMKPPQVVAAPPPMANDNGGSGTNPTIVSQVITTVPSVVNPINVTVSQNNATPITTFSTVVAPAPAVAAQIPTQANQNQSGFPFSHTNMSLSNSTSSSTSSDSEPPERRRKRKRKWKDFFGRLMKEVIDKQEELQTKFLDTLEKQERERMMREEAWRVQEMAKMNREHDSLVQERSIAAAKDAAVISFLQRITEQQNAQNPNAPTTQIPVLVHQVHENPFPTPLQLVMQQPPPPPQQQQQQHHQPQPQPQPPPVVAPVPIIKNLDTTMKDSNGGGGENNMMSPSPSRWPKAEVQALIRLRTTLDMKYQENGPKGPLWEEISASLRKLGYNRNAKRCKEKWENINKYYKKVKESSKKRPEDSKTCPYFHQLDAIYREKAKTDGFGSVIKPEIQMAPIMAQPEQQWPLPQQQQRSESTENMDQNIHEDEEDEDEDDDEEDEGAEYEIVTNKTSSMATVE